MTSDEREYHDTMPAPRNEELIEPVSQTQVLAALVEIQRQQALQTNALRTLTNAVNELRSEGQTTRSEIGKLLSPAELDRRFSALRDDIQEIRQTCAAHRSNGGGAPQVVSGPR